MQGQGHEPTSLSREKVAAFSCAGFAQAWIAKYFNIDEDTLVKYYSEELHNARLDKVQQVAAHAYRRALEGSDKMAELILRTQARWANAKSAEEIESAKLAAQAQLSILEQLSKQQEQLAKQQETK